MSPTPVPRPMMPQRPVAAAPQPQPQVRPAQPQSAHTAAQKPKKKSKFLGFLKRKWWVILIILVALALAAFTAYFAYNYFTEASKHNSQGVQGAQTDSQKVAETPEELTAEITKFIVLPNEVPEVATISNVELLKGQDFFKDAQNGDAVLIFKDAGRGLLYRPSTHKIIEYTKITFNGTLPK